MNDSITDNKDNPLSTAFAASAQHLQLLSHILSTPTNKQSRFIAFLQRTWVSRYQVHSTVATINLF